MDGKLHTVHKSETMVKKLMATLVTDFPEYTELNTILALSSQTWPRFGMNAEELSLMYGNNPYLFSLLQIAVN